jgi:multidrug resistance protein, MATE family
MRTAYSVVPWLRGKLPRVSLFSRACADAAAIARLAGPLLVNNLATVGMLFTDTVMTGRLGARELAAVAVGANYVGFFYLGGLGLLMALSPTVAHAYGAGQDREVGSFFRQALWISLGVSIVALLGLAFAYPVLHAIGIPADVAPLAAQYCYAIAFGLPAMYAFLALRFSSEGIGWTRPILFTALVALATKVLLNYALIYGHLGAPPLGAVGAGIATAIVDWLIFAILWIYVRRHRTYRPFAPLQRFEPPDFSRIREILRLALPISGSVLAEGALFASAALIMGTFGASVMAAHAIAINYAALMFMVPLSLHSATTIHVGHKVGRGDPAAGRFAGWTGIALCVVIMSLSALVLTVAREPIAGLYTSEHAVLPLATHLLAFAAVFQVADGLQVGAAGALRGFKDARIPMLLNVFSYWIVGFPLAWWFGVAQGRGPEAVWLALIVGLFVCALLLTARYRFITQRALAHGHATCMHR